MDNCGQLLSLSMIQCCPNWRSRILSTCSPAFLQSHTPVIEIEARIIEYEIVNVLFILTGIPVMSIFHISEREVLSWLLSC